MAQTQSWRLTEGERDDGQVSPAIESEPKGVRVRHFGWWLTLVTAGALTLRVVVIVISKKEAVGGDGFAYWYTANRNAAGHWFLGAFNNRPSAIHPPVWTLILSIWALLGHHGIYSTQLLASVIGTATVAMVGLAGRQIAGDRVGLLAAGLAALYAGFWVYERALLSETVLLLVIAITLIVAYRFHDKPSMGRAALLGAMTGLLAMSRSEQLLILPLMVVPLILTVKNTSWRTRISWLAVATALTIVVIAPWTIYNLGRFQKPVVLSTQAGAAVSTGNCKIAYYGADIGYYGLTPCFPEPQPIDESLANTRDLHFGLTYAEHHLSRLPLVEFAREGRAFGYWNPFQQTNLDNAWQHVSPIFGESTSVWVYDLRLVSYWILLIPAIGGAVVLRRRRIPLYPLLAFVATVIITVALTFGETRYRAAAEVTLVLLAAVGIDAVIPSKRRGSPPAVDSQSLDDQTAERAEQEYSM